MGDCMDISSINVNGHLNRPSSVQSSGTPSNIVNTNVKRMVNNTMSRKWGKKSDWPTIATRIDPLRKQQLLKKHPVEGEVSAVLRRLVDLYLDGRIIGVRIEKSV